MKQLALAIALPAILLAQGCAIDHSSDIRQETKLVPKASTAPARSGYVPNAEAARISSVTAGGPVRPGSR